MKKDNKSCLGICLIVSCMLWLHCFYMITSQSTRQPFFRTLASSDVSMQALVVVIARMGYLSSSVVLLHPELRRDWH